MPAKYHTQSNASIFNAVRSVMSEEFKARIPEATNTNMLEVGTALTSQEFDVEFNAWQNALVNRIGLVLFFDYTINNPLAKYIYGDMAWGDAIEAIAADIVKGAPMDYGQEGKSIDPFVKCSPEAKAEYHRVMKPIQYCTTIEKDRIREAFTREGGLQRLIGMFVSKLYASADLDTWILTKNEMAFYINDAKKNTGLPLLDTQKVTSQDVTDEVSAKKFILQIKNALSAAKFPNASFNPQKLHKALTNRDFTLFINASILNTIGVEAMASAFNPEQLNMNVRFEPMDDFGSDPKGGSTDDVMAVLAEDEWLLITQQFDEMESIYNPRGRYWNYFLTRKMSFGTTYFKDCIIFRKSWDGVGD